MAVGSHLHAASLNVLYNFTTSNQGGFNPQAGLVQGSDGNFYGTSSGSGSGNDGTVFKMTPAGTLTTLVSFNGANGANPQAGLVQGSDGNFYGTTESGGSSGDGTVFMMTPAGVLTTLVSFSGANGANPYAGLVQGSDGNFYGTTEMGGSANDGTVFMMTPAGALTTLVSFNGANGASPYAGLVQGRDGNFYGTTSGGGNSGHGVIFQWVVPPDYYNGVLPVLTSQVGSSGVPGSQGLVQVKVTDGSGHPLANAPITLSVTTGASTISATTTPGSLTLVNVLTDSNGIASVYVTFGTFATDVLTATAQSGSQSTSISINLMPSFSNASISGMLLWLKADTGVTVNSSGFTWPDQSNSIPGGNSATQGSASQEPALVANALNGLPVVHFNASNQQYLSLPNVMKNPTGSGQVGAGEIFAVVRSTGAPGAIGGLWAWGTANGSIYPNSDGTVWDDFGTNAWLSLGQPAANLTQYNVYNISSSSSEWTQRFNGLVNYDRLGNNVGFYTGPLLGKGTVYQGGPYLTGDIAEVIVYNTVLTQAQRDTINAYLGNKYNLYVPPPVPASLAATALSSTQISLQWSAPARSDHVNYLVERSTDWVNFTQVASVADSLSYIDTGLSASTAYTYRVRAQGYAGTSGYSNTLTVTTLSSGTDMPLGQQQGQPGMVLWLKADAGLNAGLVSTWVDQTGNGNSATQGSALQEPALVANALNGLPVVHFNASNQQYLSLPNVMKNPTGSGQVGVGEIFAVVRSAPPAGTIGGLWAWGGAYGSMYPNSDGTVYDDFGTNAWLSLGQPASDLTQFHVYNISASSTEWTQRFDGLVNYDRLGNTVGFTAAPLLGKGTVYQGGPYLTGDIAEVIVYNTVLTPAQRDTVNMYLSHKYNLNPPPPPPAGLTAVSLSSSQISLQWHEPPQGGHVNYLVERSTDGVNFTLVVTVPDSLSYIDTGLTAGTTYTYYILAQGYDGVSGSSTTLSVQTLPGGTDMPLTGMRLWLKADAGLGAGGGVDIWLDQSGCVPANNATQTSGAIRPTLVANGLNGLPVVHFDGTKSLSLNLPNVMNGATAGEIFAVVRSTAPGDLWEWGQSSTGNTYPNGDGTILEDFATGSGAIATGTPAQDLTQFNIYNVSGSSTEWTQRFNGLVRRDQVGSSTVNFTATPILGAGYLGSGSNPSLTGDIAEIVVYDHVLTPAQRDAVNAYLANKYNLYSVPPAPAALSATPFSPGQISLRWQAPLRHDHVDYLVERSTDGINFTQVAAVADSLSCIDTGLAAATSYTYRVRAQAYTGVSGYSGTASATTPASGTNMPLTGMALWLKADAGLSTSAAIDAWLDQSGNGYVAAQNAGTAQPTLAANQLNGGPAVHFAGSPLQDLNLPNVMNGATAGEIFAVVRSVAGGHLWEWGQNSTGNTYPDWAGNVLEDFGTASGISTGKPAQELTEFNVYNVSSGATEWTQRFNGLVHYDQTGSYTVSFTATPTLGGGYAGDPGFSGDLAEVIVYNQVLAPAQRDAVNAYLINKYNLYPAAPAPAGLSATPVSTSQIGLQWQEPPRSDHVSYLVERSTDGINFTQVAAVPDSLNYIDSGLAAGVNYAYRVRAQGYRGVSAYSNTASATPLSGGNSTAVPSTGLRLWLRADAGFSAPGPVSLWPDQSVLGNNATQSTPASEPVLVANVINGYPVVRFDATQSQYLTLPNLMNTPTVAGAGEVFVVVKSSAAAGVENSLWTFNSSSGNPQSAYYPDSNGSIDDAFGSNGENGPITPASPLGQFNVYNVSAQAGSWVARLNNAVVFSSNTNTVAWSSTTPMIGCSPAYYNVFFSGDIAEIIIYDHALLDADRSAVNLYLTQKYNLGSGNTPPPTVPTGLTETSSTLNGVTISWSPSTDNVGVTGYDIYNNGILVGSTIGTSYTVTGLSPNTFYNITVEAKDAAGNESAASAALSAATFDASAPTGLSVSNITATSFLLSWKASAYAVTGYNVYFSGTLAGSSTGPSLALTGLTPGTTYDVTVEAYDAAGNLSPASVVQPVRTSPYAPVGLSASNIFATALTLSWTPESGNPEVIGYNVYNNGAWVDTVSGSSYTLRGLSPSTTYNLTVQAQDDTGNISAASSLSVTTAAPDTTPPTVPGNLTYSNPTGSSVALSWTASSDNVGVADYDIYANGVEVGQTTGTSFTVTGLDPNVTYNFTVKAQDGSGNLSAASTSVPVTLGPATLPASGLQLWLSAGTGVTADGSGNITAWTDERGGTNPSLSGTATLTASGQNGLPVVHFNGTNNYFTVPPSTLSSATAAEVFVVVRSTPATSSSTNELWVLGTNTGAGYPGYPTSQGTLADGFFSTAVHAEGAPPVQLSNFNIYNVSSQANDWEARLNGVNLFTTSSNTVASISTQLLTLGADIGPRDYFTGDVAELIIYNRVLSPQERQAVGDYLNGKYALFNAPSAPTGLTLMPISGTQMSLTWQGITGAGHINYIIERSTDGVNFTQIASVSDATSYIDTGLTVGASYTYRVLAQGYAGTSGPSSAVAASTLSTGGAMPLGRMALWLSAGAVDAGPSGNFSNWPDLSGNGNNLTGGATLTAGALNGQPVVHFNGASDYFYVPPSMLNGATAAEAFVVVRSTSSSTNPLWILGANVGAGYPTAQGTLADGFFSTAVHGEGAPSVQLSNFNIYNVSSQANDWESRLNGVNLFTTSSNTVASTSTQLLTLGADFGSRNYFSGDIAELIVYNRVLTPAERQAVTGYLSNKYALIGVPPAPANLALTPLSGDQIAVQWQEPLMTAPVTYLVERSGDNGETFTQVAAVQNALSYIDTGLTAGASYTYRVQAQTYAGTSVPGSAATVATLANATADMPLTGMRLWLKADSGMNGAGRMAYWTDQSGSGNNAKQGDSPGYQPTLVANVLNGYPAVRFDAAQSEYLTLPSLMNNPTVAAAGDIFIVVKSRAQSGARNALWTFNSLFYQDDFGSETFWNISYYPDKDGFIHDYFGSSSGQGPITPATTLGQFNIYNATAQQGLWTARMNGGVIFQSQSNTVAWDTASVYLGLGPGNYENPSYNFSGDMAELIVYDHVLSDAQRTAVNLYLTQKYNLDSGNTPPPTVPTGLTETSSTLTSVTISWSPSTDSVGVTGYDIYNNGILVGSTTTGTNYTVTGLSPNTFYNITVEAKDAAGNASAASAAFSAPTVDTIPPTAPTGLVVSNVTANAFNLSWTASTDNYAVTGYNIYLNGTLATSLAGTTAILTGLTPGMTYDVTVEAYDAAGNLSPASVVQPVRTSPYAPAGLSASNIFATALTLSWTPESGNLEVIGYDVYNDGAWVDTVSGSSYTLRGLSPNTTYNLTVQAEDDTGNISAASSLSVTTAAPDTTPPTVPGNVTYSNPTGGSVALSWTASTDNVGVTGYAIYANGVQVGQTTGTSFTVTGLDPNVTYNFTVKAQDGSGNLSAASAAVPVTLAAATLPASGLQLWLSAGTGVTADGSGNITAWADERGGINPSLSGNATLTASAQNGQPVVHFNGSNNYFNVPTSLLNGAGAEAFVVVRSGSGSTGSLWYLDGDNPGVFGTSGESYPAGVGSPVQGNLADDFFSTTAQTEGVPPVPLSTFNIYNVSSTTGDWEGRMNGVGFYTTTSNAVPTGILPAPWYLGAEVHNYGYAYGPINYFTGDMAEVIVYNRVLTPQERQAVGDYLNSKYALFTAPSVPGNLTVTPISGTQMSLTWQGTTGDGHINYIIERSTDGVNFTQIASVSDATSYIDTGLTVGANYTYRVCAQGYAGTSGPSSAVAASTLSTGGAMPLGRMALWLSAGAVDADPNGNFSNWIDLSGNGHNLNGSATLTAGALNGQPVVHFNGTSNYFTVPQSTLSGASAAEAFVVVRAGSGSPNASTTLWILGTNSGSAYPAGSAGIPNPGTLVDGFFSTTVHGEGPPSVQLTNFNLYNVSSQANDWESWLNGANLFTTSSNTLPSGTLQLPWALGCDEYWNNNWGGPAPTNYFNGDVAEVIVYNRVLTPPERRAVNAYLGNKYMLFGPPPTPVNLSLTPLSGDQMSVQWQAPQRSDPVTYLVERSAGGGAFVQVATVQNSLSYIDTGLNAGASYTYKVVAQTPAGTSAPSNQATAATLASGTTDMPLTGIQLWLKADAGYWAAGSVAHWTDQSGLGQDATQTNDGDVAALVENQLNGRPVVHFDGKTSYFALPSTLLSNASAAEAFVVLRAASSSPASTATLWYMGSNGAGGYPNAGGALSDGFFSTTVHNEGLLSVPITNFSVYDVGSQAGDWEARLNGLPIASTTNNATSSLTVVHGVPVVWTLGANSGIAGDVAGDAFWPSWNQFFAGDIAEVIIYNQVLTPPQRQAVTTYLNGKYALYNPPAAPTGLTATALSPGQVLLQWQAPLTGTHVNYLVERSTDGVNFSQVASVADASSYIDLGLAPATKYYYRLQAQNAAGTSAAGNTSNATTLASGTANDVPMTGMRLWLKADAGMAGAGVLPLWLDQSGSGNHAVVDPAATPSGEPILVTNVLNGYPVVRFAAATGQYLILPNLMNNPTVAAGGDIFVVVKSSAASGTSNPIWTFGLNVGQDGSGDTVLTYYPSYYPDNGGSIDEYFGANTTYGPFTPTASLGQFNIYNATSQSGSWAARLNDNIIFQTHTNTVSWTNNEVYLGIDPGTYSSANDFFSGDMAELIIYDHALSGPDRVAVNSYLADKYNLSLTGNAPPPTSPTGVAAASATSTTATVSWTASTDPNGVAGYNVYVNGQFAGSSASASYTLTGLIANTTYAITVTATDAQGNESLASSPLQFTFVDPVPPTAPTGLAAGNVTASSFTLTWTASTDGAGVAGYNVYEVNSGVYNLIASTPTTSFALSSLRPGSTYNMAVEAFDTAGNTSASSAVVPVVTLSSAYTATPATGAIAAGAYFSAAIKSNGTLLAWGLNSSGQLGDGTATMQTAPEAISAPSGLTALSAGTAHVLALKSDGTVWAWGANASGQLGNGSTTQSSSPVQVTALSGITAIAAGSAHSLALKYDGTVWAWGANASGQLGNGGTTQSTAPIQVPGLSGIVAIAAGASHSLAVDSNGHVWTWGLNSSGQLGNGGTTQGNSPVQLASLSNIASVAAGQNFSFALTTAGAVWAWGANASGQLGDGTTTQRNAPVPVPGLSNVTAIAAGQAHTVALETNGTVWTWGSNSLGQLGDASRNIVPSVSQRSSPAQLTMISGAVGIAAGQVHTLILRSDGSIVSIGDDTCGELGDGVATAQRLAPIQAGIWTDTLCAAAGAAHTLAVRDDHSLWVWGANASGQLGDGTTTDQYLPEKLPAPACSKVAAGSAHSLALATDGTVWAWGSNANGQLGDGTTTQRTAPVKISTLSGVTTLAAGASHSLALDSSGNVWAWGLNSNGQLGNGGTTQSDTPVKLSTLSGIIAISAGASHSLALKSDGTVWAWGSNANGQLGDGTTTQRTAPVKISTLSNIIAIAAGASHSLAVDSNGDVWAWGLNSSGQLGDDTTTQRNAPVQTWYVSGIASIAAGAAHSLALDAHGNVYAWGSNAYGQVGNPYTQANVPNNIISGVAGIAAGGNFSLAVCTDHTLRLWGSNSNGQIGTPLVTRSLAATCLIPSTVYTPDGLSVAWAMAEFGNLNQSATADYDGDGLTNIQEFALGTDPTQANDSGNGLTDPVNLDPSDYYEGVAPVIAIVSGNNQAAVAGQFNAQPFKLLVTNAAGEPLPNAPVTFTVLSGGGALAATSSGSPAVSAILSLTTAADGTVQVYYQQPPFEPVASQIQVAAGLAQATLQTSSIGGANDPNNNGLPNSWELQYFGNTNQPASGDPDNTGFTNLEHYLTATNPTQPPASNSAAVVNLTIWTPLQ